MTAPGEIGNYEHSRDVALPQLPRLDAGGRHGTLGHNLHVINIFPYPTRHMTCCCISATAELHRCETRDPRFQPPDRSVRSPADRRTLLMTWFVRSFKWFRISLVFLAPSILAGCATPPADPDALAAFKEVNDPLEPMNRYFFEINYALDETLGKALAGWYYVALPNFAQDGVRNAINNLHSPVVLANDLAQGETDRAGVTAVRFLINSTIGVAGLFDLASRIGLSYHDEDFGQTLAVYGIGEGPYLMLPLLGPSNPRDLAGRVVDMIFDPLTYIAYGTNLQYVSTISTAQSVLDVVDDRARNLKTLDEVRKGSLDYYATIRSLYRQHRESEINNGKPADGGGPDDSLPLPKSGAFRPSEPPALVALTTELRCGLQFEGSTCATARPSPRLSIFLHADHHTGHR